MDKVMLVTRPHKQSDTRQIVKFHKFFKYVCNCRKEKARQLNIIYFGRCYSLLYIMNMAVSFPFELSLSQAQKNFELKVVLLWIGSL